LIAAASSGAESSPLVFEFHTVLGPLDSEKIGNDSATDSGPDSDTRDSVLRLAQELLIGLDAPIGEDAQNIFCELVISDRALTVHDNADRGLERFHKSRLQGSVRIGPLPYDFDLVDFPDLLGKTRVDNNEGQRCCR
jgi:hypothetical protein